MLNRRQIKALEALIELENRANGTSSAELACTLSLSRDSVHQLLLPLVRSGWVVAGRGRLGGYRVTPAASQASVLDVVSTFSHRGSAPASPGTPKWIRKLEDRADEEYRGVLASITIGEVAGAVRAERDALTWVI
ncbi:MAG: Rrf2 family transcriptional regulator [Acidithiobacillales bacterium]